MRARRVIVAASAALVTAAIAACGLGDDEPEKTRLRASPGFDRGTYDASKWRGGACPELPQFASENCDLCLAVKCQASCEACNGDPACNLGFQCLRDCTTTTCRTGCFSSMGGASLDRFLGVVGDEGCGFRDCAEQCATLKRIGDVCTENRECVTDVCDVFCTRACTSDDDCTPSSDGRATRCVRTNQGTACYPGCTIEGSSAECREYSAFHTCRPVNAGGGPEGGTPPPVLACSGEPG